MPLEKPTSNSGRPLMPTLSANNKAQKAPLTPRVVGSTTSPLLRRGAPQLDTTPKANGKEELSTPIKAFISANITPRSSSRKAKIDSTTSTPTGTPTGSSTPSQRPSEGSESTLTLNEDGDSESEQSFLETGITTKSRPRSMLSDTNGSVTSYNPATPQAAYDRARSQSKERDSPKFFYASDARAGQQRTGPSRPPFHGKSSSFVYANGIQDESASSPTNTRSPLGADLSSKFFHANGTPDLSHANSSISSASTPPNFVSPRLAAFSPHAQSPRPPSPSKSNPRLHATAARGPPLASPPVIRPKTSPMSINTKTPTQAARPRTAQNSPARAEQEQPGSRRSSHGRSASVGSIDSSPSIRKLSRDSSVSSGIVAAAQTASPSLILEEDEAPSPTTSHVLAVQSNPAPRDPPTAPRAPGSVPQSPTKAFAVQGGLQAMQELAAAARRERKVQDLEISNSSLLAINRALERKMRDQSAELRRFRRLSRSGRLSLASSAIGGSIGNLAILTETSDHSTSESEDETEDDSLSYSSDEPDDDNASSLSPSALAESDARHRFKDEKRLKLDLAKHKQQLIDSQKMNQSIKRCLGWTEELIKDGRRALEYTVRVSDVELGGRVLSPDEVEGVDEEELYGLAGVSSRLEVLERGNVEAEEKESGVKSEEAGEAGQEGEKQEEGGE
ncbi:MAG: hypothetical protein M1824_001379 [Vezdaea acicularis]|nr:MAG: hypothetical protein M1824_001379 [Vezdaea acicularis]